MLLTVVFLGVIICCIFVDLLYAKCN